MSVTVHRELEEILHRCLRAFATTKQKLNRFERERRDRVEEILREVEKSRRARSRVRSGHRPDPAR